MAGGGCHHSIVLFKPDCSVMISREHWQLLRLRRNGSPLMACSISTVPLAAVGGNLSYSNHISLSLHILRTTVSILLLLQLQDYPRSLYCLLALCITFFSVLDDITHSSSTHNLSTNKSKCVSLPRPSSLSLRPHSWPTLRVQLPALLLPAPLSRPVKQLAQQTPSRFHLQVFLVQPVRH